LHKEKIALKQIQHKAIGISEPVCPHCSAQLEKMPERKKKCYSCGNFIYVKNRPLDRKRVLVTETEAEEIEKQWQAEQAINALKQEYLYVKAEFDEFKEQLTKKFGKEPSDNDVFWAVYNKQSLDFAQKAMWGLYRNTRYKMAQLLLRENKIALAFESFLEVCYIDANGPRNAGDLIGTQKFNEYPYFDEKLGIQAPGVLFHITDIAMNLRYTEEKLEQEFFQVANQIQAALKLPLSPKDAWAKIKMGIALI